MNSFAKTIGGAISTVWNWSPKFCVIDHGQRRPIIDHGMIIFSSIKIQETPHSIEEPWANSQFIVSLNNMTKNVNDGKNVKTDQQ